MPQKVLLCMSSLNILFTTMKCYTAHLPTKKFVSKLKKKGNTAKKKGTYSINDFYLASLVIDDRP